MGTLLDLGSQAGTKGINHGRNPPPLALVRDGRAKNEDPSTDAF
jgi:hypothetical protein